jgi:hypothetical protein
MSAGNSLVLWPLRERPQAGLVEAALWGLWCRSRSRVRLDLGGHRGCPGVASLAGAQDVDAHRSVPKHESVASAAVAAGAMMARSAKRKRRRGKRARQPTVPSLLPFGPFELPQFPDVPLEIEPFELPQFPDVPPLVLEPTARAVRKLRRRGGT